MNTKPDTLAQDEAFALQIMQAARTIQPDPTFAEALEQRLAVSAPIPARRKMLPRIIRIVGSIAAGFLLASVIVFTVPPLRAIAHEIVNFLTHTPTDQASLWVSNPVSSDAQVFISVEEAEAASGHDFVEPQTLPSVRMNGHDLHAPRPKIVYDASVSQLRMMYRYDQWHLWFLQIPSEFYHAEDALIGESAEVETVTFNFRGHTVLAQFVRGGWAADGALGEEVSQAIDQGTPVPVTLTWVNDHRIALTWSSDGMVYMLYSNEEDFFKLTRDKLIELAESIQ